MILPKNGRVSRLGENTLKSAEKLSRADAWEPWSQYKTEVKFLFYLTFLHRRLAVKLSYELNLFCYFLALIFSENYPLLLVNLKILKNVKHT
jgi:hypothetical protein